MKLALLSEIGAFSSWNARGLFSVLPTVRRAKLGIANRLGNMCKLLFFQETHGEAADWTLGFLPEHFKFISPHASSKNKGGVMIAVHRDLLSEQYDWDHIHGGRIARVRLASKSIDEAIISLYVVHLEGDDNSFQQQIAMISELKRVLWDDESDLVMLAGDFNFSISATESDDLASETSSVVHARLAAAFENALPQFTAINPLGYTNLTYASGLDRCYVNVPLEALDMNGFECISLPYPSFFGKGRPSDHLPIVVRAQHRPRPLVPPLARAHALAAEWKEFALQELQRANFADLPCMQRVSLLPILLKRASLSYRRSSERIDAANDELGLYYATRCLRCAVRGDFAAAYQIVVRAPHWKLQQVLPTDLPGRLAVLVRELRLRVWTARSKDMYDESGRGGVLDDAPSNRRAKVQRWSSILAAWRGSFKQSSQRALMVDSDPILDPLGVAQALTREWRDVFEVAPPPPVAHALEAFLAHALRVAWPPQPVYMPADVVNLLKRCPPSAPGPDGLHYAHLAAVGSPIAEHLAALANQWIEHGLWSSDLKHSFLVPLAKSANEPWTPSQTRPITLANTSGKILMRMLACSLYSCLSSVIVRSQKGFLPGRQIAECILELEASCLSLAPTHPGAAAIFLDIRKAFDSLDLRFLFALLERSHAPEWLVLALRAAYAETSLAFIVHGTEGPCMRSVRGLRQGCPASAILFVFCLDPILRWLDQMSNPSPKIIGYADDVALVLADIRGVHGARLSEFVLLLPLATALHINFGKTMVLPLHRDLAGKAIAALRAHLDDWCLASECSRTVYLGVWVGHDASAIRYSTVIEKMDARVARIESLRLGFPAALGLARIVIWAVVHHTLSIFAPDECLQKAFNRVYSFMVRGPPRWLPYGVAIHLKQWKWNVAPPSLAALSLRLRFFCLIRLGHVDIPTLWQQIHDAHMSMEACLLPRSREWMHQSSVAALHDLERLACLGNLVVRENGILVMRSRLRAVIASPKPREKLMMQWLSSDGLPYANGKMILQTWLAKRIAWNREWDTHRFLLRFCELLPRVAKLCPLKVANAVLRVISHGIVLVTKSPEDRGCILSKTCGGSHSHDHYIGSLCWVSPQVARRFHGLFPLSRSLLMRAPDDKTVRRLGMLCYHLVRSINVCRNLERHNRPEFPVAHSLLYA